MYVNGKMRLLKTIPGMGGGRIKENVGGDEFTMIYLTYSKNFCKFHNVLSAEQKKKEHKQQQILAKI
jgi:hypothetical protein